MGNKECACYFATRATDMKTLDDFLHLLSTSPEARAAINGLTAEQVVSYALNQGYAFTVGQLVRQQTRALLGLVRRGMEMTSMDSFYYRGIGGRLFYIACITPPGM